MRRKENEITDIAEIEEIIDRATVLHMAMCNGDHPYVVPLSYGYKNRTLYIHSSREGLKIDILKKNSRVCVQFDVDDKVAKTEKACKWGFTYKSVIGFGRVTFVEDYAEKCRAYDIIMRHYSDDPNRVYEYDKKQVDKSAILRIDIDEITGKRSK